VLSSCLFFVAFVYLARNFLFGLKTAAIVRSIPVRVNVKQFATLGENISVVDCCRNIAITLIDTQSR
jgi:hypothetical protein